MFWVPWPVRGYHHRHPDTRGEREHRDRQRVSAGHGHAPSSWPAPSRCRPVPAWPTPPHLWRCQGRLASRGPPHPGGESLTQRW